MSITMNRDKMLNGVIILFHSGCNICYHAKIRKEVSSSSRSEININPFFAVKKLDRNCIIIGNFEKYNVINCQFDIVNLPSEVNPEMQTMAMLQNVLGVVVPRVAGVEIQIFIVTALHVLIIVYK